MAMAVICCQRRAGGVEVVRQSRAARVPLTLARAGPSCYLSKGDGVDVVTPSAVSLERICSCQTTSTSANVY